MYCHTQCLWPCSRPLLTQASTETPGHSQANLGQSLVGSLLVSPWSWCTQDFISALQASVAPILYKFWWLHGGFNGDFLQEVLCHTQVCCTQSPCPCDRSLLTCTSTGDTQTLKGRSGSVCAVSWVLIQKRIWTLQASLVGMGFDPKCNFAPPTILLGLLLLPWRWVIFYWWDPALSCQWLLLSYCL